MGALQVLLELFQELDIFCQEVAWSPNKEPRVHYKIIYIYVYVCYCILYVTHVQGAHSDVAWFCGAQPVFLFIHSSLQAF